MKKLLSIVLAVALMLGVTACGGNASGSSASDHSMTAESGSGDAQIVNTAEKAEESEKPKEESAAVDSAPGSGTRKVDSSEELTIKYEKNSIWLLDSKDVSIAASSVKYAKKDSSPDMELSLILRIHNNTNKDIVANVYREDTGELVGSPNMPAGKEMNKGSIRHIRSWNCMIGDTEECCQGKYRLEVMQENTCLHTVVFDWFVSEKRPFVNIIADGNSVPDLSLDSLALAQVIIGPEETKKEDAGKTAGEAKSTEESKAPEETKDAASMLSGDTDGLIRIGISGNSPINQKIWNTIQSAVAIDGIELEQLYFSEAYYNGLSSREFDIISGDSQELLAHDDRLDHFLQTCIPIGYTTFAPVSIYSASHDSLEELGEGSVITIPMTYNTGGYSTERLVRLLEAAGLITVKDPADMPEHTSFYFEDYIQENLKGISFEYIPDYSMLDMALRSSDAIIGPGSFDPEAKLLFDDPGLKEEACWNTLWIRAEDTKDAARLDAYEKIVDAYQSNAIAEILKEAGASVVPVGWDIDLVGQYRK